MDNNSIKNNICKFRKQKNMTQEEMAGLLGKLWGILQKFCRRGFRKSDLKNMWLCLTMYICC